MQPPSDGMRNELRTAHEQCLGAMFSVGGTSGITEKVKVAVCLTLDEVSFHGWRITDLDLVFTGNAPAVNPTVHVGTATGEAVFIPPKPRDPFDKVAASLI